MSITSVINNLTSTSTTDHLSAAQGKVLNDKIDNLAWLGKIPKSLGCYYMTTYQLSFSNSLYLFYLRLVYGRNCMNY